MRFELTRAEPNRFLIYRLNHSAKVSCLSKGCHLRGSFASNRRNRSSIGSASQRKKKTRKTRQRRDLNPRVQSPIDFESISLTTRTRCLAVGDGYRYVESLTKKIKKYMLIPVCVPGSECDFHLPLVDPRTGSKTEANRQVRSETRDRHHICRSAGKSRSHIGRQCR